MWLVSFFISNHSHHHIMGWLTLLGVVGSVCLWCGGRMPKTLCGTFGGVLTVFGGVLGTQTWIFGLWRGRQISLG